jgi:peptidoglycan/xylan/chitin deacetylase (PgdA/CDA1 family)
VPTFYEEEPLTQSGTVCLTFDFDAASLWISRNMLTPTPISRGEFGVVAVPRLLNLLSERGLPSTWFIPGHTIETYPEVCREIVAAEHEVGLHGYAHENVGVLDEKQEREMFRRIHGLVGDLAGIPPKGNRAPAWDLTPYTVDILLDLGLLYDSSLMGNDYSPYYIRRGYQIPQDAPMTFGGETRLVEMPVSWSLDDYPHFEYLRLPNAIMPGLKTPEDVFRNWTEDVAYMLRDFTNGVLVVTFHPQVIGRGHRMLGLERWLDELAGMGVAFERLESVVEQFIDGRNYGEYEPRRGRPR